MNTILVPVDFSEGTTKVLDYIAAASKDVKIKRVILLKSLYISVFHPVIASAEYLCLNGDMIEHERQEALDHMSTLSKQFLQHTEGVSIDSAISDLPLNRALLETIKLEKPDLIMLSSALEGKEGYISDNLIQLATVSTVPVMIIPPQARYRKINTVVVPIDFSELNRLEAIKHPLVAEHLADPILRVFSIKKNATPQIAADQQHLATLLEGYEFSAHYTEHDDILQGILQFTEEMDPELVVALPGKYNFFKKLTHRSITKAIAYKSAYPVLILKQP